MATAKLTASTYSVTGTVVVNQNETSLYKDTSNSSNPARITHTTSGTSSYYLYLKGFDFSTIPNNAVVSSFTVKVRGYESGLSTSTSYAPRLYNNTSSISGASAASSNFGTTASTITVPFTGTWDTLKGYGADLGIRLVIRRSNRNTQGYLYIYGAEIEVTYTAETVHVTGVTLNKNSTSIEEGSTEQLTATVTPSNATNQSVSWSTSNSSVATVSNGLVTAVSAGSATITATTTDGGYTASCAVTVTQPVLKQYRLATTATPGKDYLIANGNSGSVYLLSNESGGSRTLKGVAATVVDGVVSITASTETKCLFSLDLYTAGNSVTEAWSINGQYLYCDNANGLRMNSPATLDRFWHYQDNKFWQFKSTASNGYTDTSSEYKYYLTWSNGNATDSHVDTAGIANSSIPATYIFEEYTPSSADMYVKRNGSWVQVQAAYRKVNGSWQQVEFGSAFEEGVDYVMV